jgi:methyl-accepting chemotaxis protein
MTIMFATVLFVMAYTSNNTVAIVVNLLCLFIPPAIANIHQNFKNVLLANLLSVLTALFLMTKLRNGLFHQHLQPFLFIIIFCVFLILAIISIVQAKHAEKITKEIMNSEKKAIEDKEIIIRIYDRIRENAEKTYMFSKTLDKNMKSTNEFFSMLVSSFEEMSYSFDESVKAMSFIETNTTFLSEEVDQMQMLSDEMNFSAERSLTEVNITKKHLEELVNIILELGLSIEQNVQTSNILLQYSDEIHSIIDTIFSISNKINLLALNAAVEASRAGESGRGFMVVAGEVKKLAFNTKESTEKIRNILESIGEKVVQSNTQSLESKNKIKEGQHTTKMVESAFSKIEENSVHVSHHSNKISEMLIRLNKVSKEIKFSIENINLTMITNQNTLNEVRAGVYHVGQELEEISCSFADLLEKND